MTTTSLPSSTFCTNLLAALEERDGLAGVQIAYQWPGPDTAPEGIYLTDFSTGEHYSGLLVPANLTTGRQRLDDTATVPVTCQAWLASSSPQDCASAVARVEELFAHIVDAVQASPAMNQAIDWVEGIAYRTRTVPFEHQWAAQLIGSFTTHARLL